MSKLKKCPFCGYEARVERWSLPQHHAPFFIVACRDCGAMTYPFSSTEEIAIERWNNRRDRHEDED